MLKFRKMTPKEIDESDGAKEAAVITRAQLRKEHNERKAKTPKPKRRKRT